MLIEKEITKNFEDYHQFHRLYLSSFPKEERIPIKHLMMRAEESELIACYDEKLFCGFYATLTFGDVTHILFLAVDDALRGRGYGSQILKQISHRYPNHRIILDIEAEDPSAPNNEQRIRRKAFYAKNGYTESGIAYTWRNVPYQILIKNGCITEKEFDAFWDNLDGRRKKE